MKTWNLAEELDEVAQENLEFRGPSWMSRRGH